MTSYPKIWFLRHGQTEWNRAFRLQGQLDSPLTEQGIAEARRQALIMPEILAQTPSIYASPLGRVRHTADIALCGAIYQTDARLKELSAGEWQGLLGADILAKHAELAAQNPSVLDIYEAAPGGEGLSALSARVHAFLADLTGPSVVVAHGLLGQVLRTRVRGLDMSQAGDLSTEQGVVYELENGCEQVLEATS